MCVRDWWDRATERDQDAVLYHVGEPRGWAGVPWAFLPDEVQQVLTRRIRIHEDQLELRLVTPADAG